MYQICIEITQILYSPRKPSAFYPWQACSLGEIILLQSPQPWKVINYFPSSYLNSVFALHISPLEHRGWFIVFIDEINFVGIKRYDLNAIGETNSMNDELEGALT